MKIGDFVVLKSDFTPGRGAVGIVKVWNVKLGKYGIAFFGFEGGHSLMGSLPKGSINGWWISYPGDVELMSKEHAALYQLKQ